MAINQHWVPQFYLRGFTTAPGSGKVVVTDIKAAYEGNPTSATKALDKVACMDHLYSSALPDNTFVPKQTNEENPGWDPRVDQALQVIETASGNVWKKMRDDDPLQIDFQPGKDARTIVCRFLASLHLRNPRMVGVAKVAQGQAAIPPLTTQSGRDAFHSLVASTPTNMDATLSGIADRRPFLEVQSAHLNDIFSALNGLHWGFRYFPGKGAGPLCTTDTPLFCVDHATMDPTSMDSPRCLVICALTSRLLLLATGTPTTDLNGLVKTQDGKSSAAFIALMNQFIVHHGTREVYSGRALGASFPFLK